MDEPRSIADDLDRDVLDNAVSFDIAGEHRATLRVSTEVAGIEVLKETLQAVAMSTAPHLQVEVVFGSTTPPPLLVTLEDVARCLDIHTSYAKDLVKHGWLTPIHLRGVDDPNKRYARVEKALETGHWQGWEVRFLWSELVELVQWCAEHYHIPSYESAMPRRVRMMPQGVNRFANKFAPTPMSVAAAARRVLREAKDEKGNYQYLATKEVVNRVRLILPWKHISYSTVSEALKVAQKKGQIRKKPYKATYKTRRGVAWRFLAPEERKISTFEAKREPVTLDPEDAAPVIEAAEDLVPEEEI